jgi:hypothetical protein
MGNGSVKRIRISFFVRVVWLKTKIILSPSFSGVMCYDCCFANICGGKYYYCSQRLAFKSE